MKRAMFTLGFLCFAALGLSAGDVVNGLKPKGKPMTMRFTESSRVTEDNNAKFECTGTDPSVSADANGNMYVADPGGNRVLMFDKTGKFVRTIGRKGEGPGEFIRLYNFTVLDDGRAIALSGNFGIYSLHWFDQNMKFVKTTSTERGTNVITGDFSNNGKWLAARVFRVVGKKDRQFVHTTELFDQELKPVKSVPAYQIPAWDGSRTADPAYITERATDQMKGEHVSRGLFAFDAENNIYTAMTGTYEITKWDPTFKNKLLVIKKEYKPRRRTQEEIKSYIENYGENAKANFPMEIQNLYTYDRLLKGYEAAGISPLERPVQGIVPMPDGKLLIVSSITGDGSQTADIYDKQGQYLGQTTMKRYAFLGTTSEKRMSFRNGFAYTIETNEDDSHMLVRYAYELVPVK